jgi:hypothetical protein
MRPRSYFDQLLRAGRKRAAAILEHMLAPSPTSALCAHSSETRKANLHPGYPAFQRLDFPRLANLKGMA